jgi:hypothetical protein
MLESRDKLVEGQVAIWPSLTISQTAPRGIAQMSAISIVQAEVDLNTPLVLEFNEITSLMAVSGVGIIAVMVLSVVVAGLAFFGSKGQDLSQEHFARR